MQGHVKTDGIILARYGSMSDSVNATKLQDKGKRPAAQALSGVVTRRVCSVTLRDPDARIAERSSSDFFPSACNQSNILIL